MAKKTNSPSKTAAWNAFSRMIRVRDAIKTTGLPFVCICITCGKRFHLSYIQAGHCFAGRQNAKLFQEELVHGQCTRCNELFHGLPKQYRKIMDEKYGKDRVDELKAAGKKPIPNRDMDFDGRRKSYIARTNEMLKPYGYNSYEEMMRSHN